MRRVVLAVLMCLTWSRWLAAAEAVPREKRAVLVLDVHPSGVPEAEAALLGSRVAEEVARRPGLSVMTQADLRAVLSHDQTRVVLGCDSDTSCMAAVAEATSAELVLTSSLGKVGGSFVLACSLLDVKKSLVVGRVSETGESSGALMLAVPEVIGRLFGSGAGPTVTYRWARGKKASVAVLDLTPVGVSAATAQSLTQVLSTEVRRVEGTTVISRDDIVAMLQLQADKDLLGCTDNVACVAEIGGALGVDKLVVGQVGQLAGTFVISLRFIDVRSAHVDNRVSESFQGQEEQLLRAVRTAARELLGLESPLEGAVAVTASEQKAEIVLDGTERGLFPAPPVGKLKAGRHTLRLSKEGFFDWQSDVYVDPAETTAVWAVLQERPEKWYQKWWVWTIGGVVLAGTAGAIVYANRGTPAPQGTVGPGSIPVAHGGALRGAVW
jgi:hypothetical protein